MLEPVRKVALRLARPLHIALRSQKADLFLHLVGSDKRGSLLDVGGGTGIAGEFVRLYQQFENIFVLNLDPGLPVGSSSLHVTKIQSDGCNLPLGDASIDWVFSNAVIEHVGDWKKQQQFAREIQRVSRKGYFVTTPNRHFPIEPHTLLPFYQFLPPKIQARVVRFSPGYLREYEQINLLSAAQLRHLFPNAKIVGMGPPVLKNSIVAYGKSL